MKRSHFVLALTLVLALAVAVPTIGAPTGKRAVKIAKEAKRQAKKAKRSAAQAKQAANTAQRGADGANAAAAAAGAVADEARAGVAALRPQSDSANATVSTEEESEYVDLGGPQVTLTVPPSGLIEVWAQATVVPQGAVSLFEDGEQVPGQDPGGVCDGPAGALFSQTVGEELTLSTPGGTTIAFCGNTGPPGPVILEATPGEHTYSLRYADCDCGDPDPGPATFSDRTLMVAARP